ncbi:hypothetical protein BpHYR1_024818 [Brachionus plicatilis]|uniref:Uncharacterized protein n=1 Tax=Brachionus plicatilis TaxID=10195 RepID=A0A3M7PNR4_BRAPC|nr:hypothetical protein BpHYR1_024818 [Brachionus plicatilis]
MTLEAKLAQRSINPKMITSLGLNKLQIHISYDARARSMQINPHDHPFPSSFNQFFYITLKDHFDKIKISFSDKNRKADKKVHSLLIMEYFNFFYNDIAIIFNLYQMEPIIVTLLKLILKHQLSAFL